MIKKNWDEVENAHYFCHIERSFSSLSLLVRAYLYAVAFSGRGKKKKLNETWINCWGNEGLLITHDTLLLDLAVH